MQRIETSLPGVFELRPVIHRDTRGFFVETYHKAKFADLGIADAFVQDNHSRSIKGTLRGLHYQLHRPQAKLCRVVEGEALDVAECIHDPKVCERRFVICLDEEATRVAMDNPSQIKHARKGCLDSLH